MEGNIMKKLWITMMMVCTGAVLHAGTTDINSLDVNKNGNYEGAQANVEYQTGSCVCYCKVTKFEPEEYCVTHCVKEPYCVERKCTRKVPEYYTKTFCRYVPEYYQKTYCRYRTECYSVPETKYRNRTVVEKKCRMIPKCYVKRVCMNADVCQPACPAPKAACAEPKAPCGSDSCSR